jgi:hypothetical protein
MAIQSRGLQEGGTKHGGTIAGAWQEHQEDDKAIQIIARTSQVMAIKPREWHTEGAKITI